MADFSVNSKFNKDANFSQVKFGADAPLLEVELNEMQEIQEEAMTNLIKEQIPSGVFNLAKIVQSTKLNTFQLDEEMKVNVNGKMLTLPKGLEFQLSEPPTSSFKSITGKEGYREDLVFLEVWKEEVSCDSTIYKYGGEGQEVLANQIKDGRVGVETSKRIQWKWRVRVIDDFNFDVSYNVNHSTLFPYLGWNSTSSFCKAYAMGSNTQLTIPTVNNGSQIFRGAVTEWSQPHGLTDVGLWIAGNGNLTKSTFNTVDGWVYGIPLFKVIRRNSDAYSQQNSNGATVYEKFKSTTSYYDGYKFLPKGIVITINASSIPTKLAVGDYIGLVSGNVLVGYVTNIDRVRNEIKVHVTREDSQLSLVNQNMFVYSDRADVNYANKINVDTDVVDLRHKVSLTGFNYKELLEENFDKLITGNLNTKQPNKILKTYHGIRKTPIDSSTIFYASFDGTDKAEVGNNDNLEGSGVATFHNAYTGLGAKFSSDKYWFVDNTYKAITVDMFIDLTYLRTQASGVPCMRLYSGNYFVRLEKSGENYVCSVSRLTDVGGFAETKTIAISFINPIILEGMNHVRITVDSTTKTTKLYINGAYYGYCTLSDFDFSANLTWNKVGNKIKISPSKGQLVSDVMVSSVDRGDVFATLPKDFSQCNAFIDKAFNEQKDRFGDQLMGQVCTEVIKNTGETKRQFTLTKSTANWSTGDTIKVKSLGSNECIGGVVDKDTMLCIVTNIITNNKTEIDILVSTTDGIAVDDEFTVFNRSFTSNWSSDNVGVVTAIDTANRILTVKKKDASTVTLTQGDVLVETNANSSTPTLKYLNGTTLTNVVGTWKGVGTKECTFTLGSNPSLTNQNLEISYSLYTPSGLGCLSYVPTQVVSGEYKGKRLTKQSYITVVDDFAGKVLGSTVECPHSLVQRTNPELFNDMWNTAFESQYKYDGIMYYGISDVVEQTLDNGQKSQHLFRFNIVRMIEDKFGEIPSVDKVKWVHDNVSNIQVTYYGHASDGVTSKVNLSARNTKTNEWYTPVSHTESSNARLSWSVTGVSTSVGSVVDTKGFSYFMAYSEPQTGNVQTLKSDYIKIIVGLNGIGTEYDILSPENNRRDDGQSGILLVRKETKEVFRYPLGKAKESDNIVTYSIYPPYQHLDDMGITKSSVGKLLSNKKFLFSSVICTENPNSIFPRGIYNNWLDRLKHAYSLYSLMAKDFRFDSNVEEVFYRPTEKQYTTATSDFSYHSSDHSYKGNLSNMVYINHSSRGISSKLGESFTGIVVDKRIPINTVFVLPLLCVLQDGQIYMVVCTGKTIQDGYLETGHSANQHTNVSVIPIKGRPIIKEVL